MKELTLSEEKIYNDVFKKCDEGEGIDEFELGNFVDVMVKIKTDFTLYTILTDEENYIDFSDTFEYYHKPVYVIDSLNSAIATADNIAIDLYDFLKLYPEDARAELDKYEDINIVVIKSHYNYCEDGAFRNEDVDYCYAKYINEFDNN